MGADIPGAEPMRSAYLTLTVDRAEEAERLYALLSDGGQIFMKMEETFFASRFAMLREKTGTSWMLLHERSPSATSPRLPEQPRLYRMSKLLAFLGATGGGAIRSCL